MTHEAWHALRLVQDWLLARGSGGAGHEGMASPQQRGRIAAQLGAAAGGGRRGGLLRGVRLRAGAAEQDALTSASDGRVGMLRLVLPDYGGGTTFSRAVQAAAAWLPAFLESNQQIRYIEISALPSVGDWVMDFRLAHMEALTGLVTRANSRATVVFSDLVMRHFWRPGEVTFLEPPDLAIRQAQGMCGQPDLPERLRLLLGDARFYFAHINTFLCSELLLPLAAAMRDGRVASLSIRLVDAGVNLAGPEMAALAAALAEPAVCPRTLLLQAARRIDCPVRNVLYIWNDSLPNMEHFLESLRGCACARLELRYFLVRRASSLIIGWRGLEELKFVVETDIPGDLWFDEYCETIILPVTVHTVTLQPAEAELYIDVRRRITSTLLDQVYQLLRCRREGSALSLIIVDTPWPEGMVWAEFEHTLLRCAGQPNKPLSLALVISGTERTRRGLRFALANRTTWQKLKDWGVRVYVGRK